MKTGQTLQELAIELQRQQTTKHDFLAPGKTLELEINGTESLRVGEHGSFPLTNLAHTQVAQRLGIPQKYYDRLRAEDKPLLASNVNAWLQKEAEPRLVRTLDGTGRAFLSHRYRPLDYFDMA